MTFWSDGMLLGAKKPVAPAMILETLLSATSTTSPTNSFSGSMQLGSNAGAARVVVIAVHANMAGGGIQSLTGVTIAGVVATIIAQRNVSGILTAFAYATVPAGTPTTGTVVTVFSGFVSGIFRKPYAIYNCDPVPVGSASTNTSFTSATSANLSTTGSKSKVVMALTTTSSGPNSPVSWTGLLGLYGSTFDSDTNIAGATGVMAAASVNLFITAAGEGNDRALSAVAFQQA